ncbi:MAG: TldD/PmbA family protein [Bacteroidetes bacterium]|nr:TldD/PmbA family protein [Bacteroidota bacterium]
MNKQEKFELANWAVDFAKRNGADEVSVSIYNYKGSDISIRKQKIDKIQESIERGLSISFYVDNKYSSHSTNRLNKDSLERFITEAIASTKYLTKDEFRVLPDPSMYFKGEGIDLKLYDASYDAIDPKTKLDIAMQVEEETLGMDDRIIAVTSDYGDGLVSQVKVISNGFEAYEESTSFYVSASASIKDANSRPSGSDSVNSHFMNKIDAKGIGKIAVKRAIQKLGQKKIASGKYVMLLENRMAGSLLSSFLNGTYGSNLQQKRSFMEGMKGKKVASDKLSIVDNPLIISGSNSRLYDSEGLAANIMPVVEKGVLKNYYIDTYYGKKLDMVPTTGRSSNLEFAYGNRDLKAMTNGIKKGIIVTGFNGGNSNSATGDFSYGIDGLLVENGKIVNPVSEMVISGNHKTFWSQLAEVGNDPITNRSWRTASMLFEDVSFSGL